jgi:hypothetical protein
MTRSTAPVARRKGKGKRKSKPAPLPPRKPERPAGWRVSEERYAVRLSEDHYAEATLLPEQCPSSEHFSHWRFSVYAHERGVKFTGAYTIGRHRSRTTALKLATEAVHLALSDKPAPKAPDVDHDCKACRLALDRKITLLLATRPRPGLAAPAPAGALAPPHD